MKIAILFPGQGSQYIGMCKNIMQDYPIVQEVFEEAEDTLHVSMRKFIFDTDLKTLTSSENAQPAVVAASYAYYNVYLKEIGLRPDFVAGHSLGEITALVAAGGMAFEDALKFSRKRGTLMQEGYKRKVGSVALIMGLDEKELVKEVEAVCADGEYIVISGYNSKSQLLVAGETHAVRTLGERIKQSSAEFVPFAMLPMKVDAPFHTRLMDFILPDIQKELDIFTFYPLEFNVISNVTALPYESHEDIKKNLTLQLTHPIKWTQIIDYIEKKDISLTIDTGPQYIIKSFVLETTKRIKAFSFDLEEDRNELKKLLVKGDNECK